MPDQYSVTIAPKKYNVTLGGENSNLKVSVVSTTVRPAIEYHFETTSNNQYGVMNFVADQSNNIVDSIVFVGTGIANITSNSTSILIGADVGTFNVDGGVF